LEFFVLFCLRRCCADQDLDTRLEASHRARNRNRNRNRRSGLFELGSC
jgi:hypothetical protein